MLSEISHHCVYAVSVAQGFSSLTLLTFWALSFFMCVAGGLPCVLQDVERHPWLLPSNTLAPSYADQGIFRYCWMSPGGQNYLWLRVVIMRKLWYSMLVQRLEEGDATFLTKGGNFVWNMIGLSQALEMSYANWERKIMVLFNTSMTGNRLPNFMSQFCCFGVVHGNCGCCEDSILTQIYASHVVNTK